MAVETRKANDIDNRNQHHKDAEVKAVVPIVRHHNAPWHGLATLVHRIHSEPRLVKGEELARHAKWVVDDEEIVAGCRDGAAEVSSVNTNFHLFQGVEGETNNLGKAPAHDGEEDRPVALFNEREYHMDKDNPAHNLREHIDE